MIVLLLLAIPSIFITQSAFAQVTRIVEPDCGFFGRNCAGTETFETSINTYLNDVINVFVFLLGTVAMAFLVYAGFKYVMSQGDESAAATAKRQIAYALVGIVVATSTVAIRALVEGPSAVPLMGRFGPIITVFQLLLVTVTGAFLVYAGYKYVTSQGDESAAATAKRQIAYALIGLFIATSPTILGLLDLVAAQPSSANLRLRLDTVLDVLLTLVGIVAAIFLLYAGFKYISSRGDEGEAEQAKNQIVYAVIGIIVAGLAEIIATAVLNVDASALVADIHRIVTAFLILVSTVAAAYMLIAGVMYLTSQGDEEQARRAKMQIVYAAIGLFVIILSGVLVNFVINAIN